MSDYPIPDFKILVDGLDITPKINNRLIQLTLEDKRGLETDSLMIELSDHDGLLAIPPLNAIIQLWLGWKHTGLVYKGSFIATEISHSGSPDVLAIRATSADLKKTLKQKKERSFHQHKLGDIITQIAQEHQLKPHIHQDLAEIELAHIDQNESDANLIARLADEHTAIATVKNGFLLFLPKGKSETVNGQAIPTFTIIRKLGDGHQYSKNNGSDDISGVVAYYYDPNQAERQSVKIGDGSQNVKELRHFYRDKNTAIHAAQSEYNKIKSQSASLSINLAYGVADLIPEMPIQTQGFKTEIDDIIWLGTSINHQLNSNGYTTTIQAEIKMPDSDDIAQLIEEEQGDYTGVIAYYKDGKTTQKITAGEQKQPKRLLYLYKNKATAQNAVNREWKALQAEKQQNLPNMETEKK